MPREVLSREQEAWLAAYVRRLVKRRDKVAAKLIQISAEEDNFDSIISSFHALPEDDRTILQEMIFLGVKGANVCISRGCRTDRTVWRHRKAALERIALDCSRKRGLCHEGGSGWTGEKTCVQLFYPGKDGENLSDKTQPPVRDICS